MESPIPSTWDIRPRISKITIPERCNPLAQVAFREMKRQGVTYLEAELRSGVLGSTLKSWRNEKNPGLLSISAVLGALGFSLVPVPRMDMISADLRERVEQIALEFGSTEKALGAVIAAAAAWPAWQAEIMPQFYKSRQESTRKKLM